MALMVGSLRVSPAERLAEPASEVRVVSGISKPAATIAASGRPAPKSTALELRPTDCKFILEVMPAVPPTSLSCPVRGLRLGGAATRDATELTPAAVGEVTFQ